MFLTGQAQTQDSETASGKNDSAVRGNEKTAAGRRKVSYTSQNYLGLLVGENKSAFHLQSIHGVTFRSWYAGVGAGLDFYMFRSVPLFFAMNKELVLKKRTFYVSGDAGVNFGWDKYGGINYFTGSSKFEPALYWATGLGYKSFFFTTGLTRY